MNDFPQILAYILAAMVFMASAMWIIRRKRERPTRLQSAVVFTVGMAIIVQGVYGDPQRLIQWDLFLVVILLSAMIELVAWLWQRRSYLKTDHQP